MDDYEFTIEDKYLKNINFNGVLLVSSKRDENGNFKVKFLERKNGGEPQFIDDLYEDNPHIRKRIEKEFYETLIFVLQSNSASIASAMALAEYDIYNIKLKRNSYLMASLIGLISAYPIGVGLTLATTDSGKAAVLIFGGVIIAMASLKMFMNFETYVKLVKKAEAEYKQFVLDEGNKLIRKK